MSDDILASLGIRAGVDSSPSLIDSTQDTPYPTGLITFLSITTVIPWLALGYLTYKFKPVWAAYIRNRFEYALSVRTDLHHRLTYELFVGTELHSSVMIGPGFSDNLAIEERVALPAIITLAEQLPTPAPTASDTELTEVIVSIP